MCFRFPIFVHVLTLAVLVAGCGRPPRARVEADFVNAGRTLVRIAYVIPGSAAARGVLIDRQTLRSTPLYLHDPAAGSDDYLYLGADGRIEQRGQTIGTVRNNAELVFLPGTTLLFADGRPIPAKLQDWDALWVTADAAAPATRNRIYPVLAFADGFMRPNLAEGQCRVATGRWRLQQHGGGMATNPDDVHNYSFQRAVNPFAVIGEGNGRLCFGDSSWFDFHGEARFYFGVPVEGNVVDTDTLPANTDMLVAQGTPDEAQVAFGWRGRDRGFVLLGRQPGRDWRVLGRRVGPRPAITSWMKVGLSVAKGTRATAYLDGVPVLSAELPRRVTGPLAILCGDKPIKCDDVRAWSLAAPPPVGDALYARSSQFAEKERKDHSDPLQFEQWAQGADTFLQWRVGDMIAVIANRVPLLGDFTYEAEPGNGPFRMPPGLYEFRLAVVPLTPVSTPSAAWEKAPGLTARLDPAGTWSVEGLAERPKSLKTVVLRLRRSSLDGGRIALWTGSSWRPVTPAFPGPLRLMIARRSEVERSYPSFPQENQHRIVCRNLINEFFEDAPTDWSWIEGSFRMACRWACQNQWNFMACGGTGVPFMASKHTYAGRQFFEYYMSLRPVTPWDAGDASFSYDPSNDWHWEFFREHEGWYSRHDLNFAFCSDGRSPLSGYAVVFGGDDNRETRLLRQGKVVARNASWQFLFPTDENHGVVHWEWWRFSVWKDGGHIQVDLNGSRMLEYTDPAPLNGGHAGFWTVRNGFALSRATMMADEIGWRPDTLYVENSDAAAWHPLPADSATLTALPDGRVRARRNAGAGLFALRYRVDPPVNLTQTPVLELPLMLGKGTEQNLHLEIGGKSFLVQINAPLSGMKALLTPVFEKGECFRLSVISESTIRDRYLLGKATPENGKLRIDLEKALRDKNIQIAEPKLTALTLGSTSNDGYRLAGGEAGPGAGVSLEVGTPRLLKRE